MRNRFLAATAVFTLMAGTAFANPSFGSAGNQGSVFSGSFGGSASIGGGSAGGMDQSYANFNGGSTLKNGTTTGFANTSTGTESNAWSTGNAGSVNFGAGVASGSTFGALHSFPSFNGFGE